MNLETTASFYTAEEIAAILHCSLSRGYRTVRELNNEMEKNGFKTMRGRTNRRFFEKRFGLLMAEKET